MNYGRLPDRYLRVEQAITVTPMRHAWPLKYHLNIYNSPQNNLKVVLQSLPSLNKLPPSSSSFILNLQEVEVGIFFFFFFFFFFFCWGGGCLSFGVNPLRSASLQFVEFLKMFRLLG